MKNTPLLQEPYRLNRYQGLRNHQKSNDVLHALEIGKMKTLTKNASEFELSSERNVIGTRLAIGGIQISNAAISKKQPEFENQNL